MTELFVTCSRHLVPMLAQELSILGAIDCRESAGGVYCQADSRTCYRICLWSRLASRVLLPLIQGSISNDTDLYELVRELDWSSHLGAEQTLAIQCVNRGSPIHHHLFAVQRCKDAIVDWFRERHGQRPGIDKQHPDISLHLHLHRDQAGLSLDLAGSPLHRRGYRVETVEAPLKENLAAALLLRCGWPALAQAGGAFIDPMCGSGTLLIEAALMASDTAPGLLRKYSGLSGWRQFDAALWQELIEEAQQRSATGRQHLPALYGFDRARQCIFATRRNIAAAGLEGIIHTERQQIDQLSGSLPSHHQQGLLLTNPPYGERLGQDEDLMRLYRQLGALMHTTLQGWQAGVLTCDRELGYQLGYRSNRPLRFDNGPIECFLLRFKIDQASRQLPKQQIAGQVLPTELDPAAEDFRNRLRKNLRHLHRWRQRCRIQALRIYDADLPDFAFAIDQYQTDQGIHLMVQEYAPPAGFSSDKAARRRAMALRVLLDELDCEPDNIHLRQRQRQRGKAQYQKEQEHRARKYTVEEDGCSLLIDFDSYLDTGLFLDHRPTRALLRELSTGADVLNLFCYTGTATVHAVAGGARTTTSVDLSKTYLAWARDNLEHNQMLASRADRERHRLVHADCRTWLSEQEPGLYDLIFLDPPSFSNSKRMDSSFDIQRDHGPLIDGCLRLLRPGGRLLFSTNRRSFKLQFELPQGMSLEDITRSTIPEDFRRARPPHRCWMITHNN